MPSRVEHGGGGGLVGGTCQIPEPLFAPDNSPGCNVSVFSLQMSGPDTVDDDDKFPPGRERKQNLLCTLV